MGRWDLTLAALAALALPGFASCAGIAGGSGCVRAQPSSPDPSTSPRPSAVPIPVPIPASAPPGAHTDPAGGVAAPVPSTYGMAAADSADGMDGEEGEEDLEDGHESAPPDAMALTQPQAQRSPLLLLSDRELEERYRRDPTSLGSMSVGLTSAGALINGVQMPKGSRWEFTDPGNAWGTRETIDFLIRSIDKVNEQFPDAPPMYIGHISSRHGGHLSPHVSHQAGRDVDVGYYYLKPSRRWFARATAENLDLAKTWAFVRAVITETDVEMILTDTSIQRLLVDYASKHGEDEAWLDSIFQVRGKNSRPILRHAKGHATHLHLRFYNAVAQEMGRRAFPWLVQSGVLKPRVLSAAAPAAGYISHKVRKGEILMILAKRYGTTAEAIQQANGLKSPAVRIGQVLRIPKRGAAPARSAPRAPRQPPGPIAVPPRRLPPVKQPVAGPGSSASSQK